MPKLTAKEVNILKYECEGREQLEALYNRLRWGEAKTVRLNFLEKDALHEILGQPEEYYLDDETVVALAKAVGMVE